LQKEKADIKKNGDYPKPNEEANDTSAKTPKLKRDVSKITCFKCGKKGHYANTCKTKLKEQANATKVLNKDGIPFEYCGMVTSFDLKVAAHYDSDRNWEDRSYSSSEDSSDTIIVHSYPWEYDWSQNTTDNPPSDVLITSFDSQSFESDDSLDCSSVPSLISHYSTSSSSMWSNDDALMSSDEESISIPATFFNETINSSDESPYTLSFQKP